MLAQLISLSLSLLLLTSSDIFSGLSAVVNILVLEI